jgi:hypothetical protein
LRIPKSEIRISSFTPVAEHLDGDVGRDFLLSRSLCALLLRNERPQKTTNGPLALRDSGSIRGLMFFFVRHS